MTDPEHDLSSESGTPQKAAPDPHKPSGWRRAGHIIGAVVVGVVLPALLVGWLVGEFGVAAMITGLLLGSVGAKIGGTRRMLYLSPGLGIAAGVGAFTAYHWTWVALLTLVGVIAGAGLRFGWLPATLMIPYAATFVTQESTVVNAVIYGVILALGTLYGVVIARRFGKKMKQDRFRRPAGSVRRHEDRQAEAGQVVQRLIDADQRPEPWMRLLQRDAERRRDDTLEAIDRDVNGEVDQGDEPEPRRDDQDQRHRHREMDEAMRQQRQRPAGLLILADRHPGSLQHEIGDDVLHREKQHPSHQHTNRDRRRHRRKQQS